MENTIPSDRIGLFENLNTTHTSTGDLTPTVTARMTFFATKMQTLLLAAGFPHSQLLPASETPHRSHLPYIAHRTFLLSTLHDTITQLIRYIQCNNTRICIFCLMPKAFSPFLQHSTVWYFFFHLSYPNFSTCFSGPTSVLNSEAPSPMATEQPITTWLNQIVFLNFPNQIVFLFTLAYTLH